VGADGLLCGFLGVNFPDVEAHVHGGGTDAEVAEWIFARGSRRGRTQAFGWNEFSRKIGWNDRVTAYLARQMPHRAGQTWQPPSFALIDLTEGRIPPGSVNAPAFGSAET
jgi:hypothetical protein